MVNYEARNLIERLRDWDNTSFGRNRKDMIKAADLLEKLEERLATIYSPPVELPEADLYRHDFVDEETGETDFEVFDFKSEDCGDCKPLYTADQLTKAVQEATARALEAAAKECEKSPSYDWHSFACETATAIRNLIGNVPLRGVK